MAYKATYINKLDQFDGISYTLILEDEDGIMPTIRNDKFFNRSKYPEIYDSTLEIEANKDIAHYTQKFLDEQD